MSKLVRSFVVIITQLSVIPFLAGLFVACSDSSDNNVTEAAIVLAALQSSASGSATCASPSYCLMFITNANATLNAGISGLDTICANDANKPAGSATYKAMVSDGTNRRACTTANCSGGTSEHINWVLKPAKQYRRTDGTTIIGTTTANGVLTFPLTNPVQTTVVGTNSTVTGLNANWTASANDCTDYSGVGTTSNGLHDDTSTNFLNVGSGGCGNTMKVICVEQ